jgi:hypothetical protein
MAPPSPTAQPSLGETIATELRTLVVETGTLCQLPPV